MTGVVGALVALAVVVALVLVLAVRPHVRRLARTVEVLRADTGTRLERLRVIRAERPRTVAVGTSSVGGRGRHRQVETAP